MERLFVRAFDYFHRRPRVLAFVFPATVAVLAFFALQIKISENVSDIFPDDKESETFNEVFHSRALEKLAFMVSATDSAQDDPEELIRQADTLVSRINSVSHEYIDQITFRIDDQRALEFYNSITEHLPVFLTDDDYLKLDSLLEPGRLARRIESNYRQLVSPAGLFTKRMYSKDIIGITQLGLSKIKQLQYDENYVLYDNCLFTKDLKHVLFFVAPRFPSSNTGQNIHFIDQLNKVVKQQNQTEPNFRAAYFGGTAVAVGNAVQLRRDTWLTTSIMLVLLVGFVLWFFKRKRAPIIVLVPVVFGALLSLACLSVLKGSVSVLALAAGSIVLGIAVNYSLHFIVHLQHVQDKRETIRNLTGPMTLGSATTVLAFFGLQFANASILRDIGLFAGFSLIGAALCSLLFLPHFVKTKIFRSSHYPENFLNKFFLSSATTKRLSICILLVTPLFLYFAGDAKFNSDMNKLNFMSEELTKAQDDFYSINEVSFQSVYLVVKGANKEEALKRNEKIQTDLKRWREAGIVRKYLSPSLLLVSDSLQKTRIEKWRSYWTKQRKEQVKSVLIKEGARLKFSRYTYDALDNFIDGKYEPLRDTALTSLQNAFFGESVLSSSTQTLVITPVMVERGQKESLYAQLNAALFVTAIDRQTLTNNFIAKVNADFTFIVAFTSVIVFFALLLAYRKIELALITFIPMFITWVWILGIMALFHIEFNLINVMVSTFIFGLGDDYSIFTMDGLQRQQRDGATLTSVRVSVFVSSITTIIGLGVLIFAKHPALQSIALISITGIACVWVMSQTLEPFLYEWIVSARVKRGLKPMTILGMLNTFMAYFCFSAGSLALAFVGFIVLRIPFAKGRAKRGFHVLISFFARVLVDCTPNLRKRIVDGEGVFDKPSIVICNHASFLDILLTVGLTPKVILLTNKWVWNSPVFGAVVRLAEYYPVDDGAEEGVARLKRKVDEGFSVVIFPEGTRSPDGKMQRFHKGAFYLAEKLGLDIRPLLILGAHEAIPKGDFYINRSNLTLKFLPLISLETKKFGATYQERTKAIGKYFKSEFAANAEDTQK